MVFVFDFILFAVWLCSDVDGCGHWSTMPIDNKIQIEPANMKYPIRNGCGPTVRKSKPPRMMLEMMPISGFHLCSWVGFAITFNHLPKISYLEISSHHCWDVKPLVWLDAERLSMSVRFSYIQMSCYWSFCRAITVVSVFDHAIHLKKHCLMKILGLSAFLD